MLTRLSPGLSRVLRSNRDAVSFGLSKKMPNSMSKMPSESYSFVIRTLHSASTLSSMSSFNTPIDKFEQPHPSARPTDIAYFTGNPEYYSKLEALNAYIRHFQNVEIQKCLDEGILPPKQTLHFRYKSMDLEEFGSSVDLPNTQGGNAVPPYESDARIKDALPPWMSREEMQNVRSMKLRADSYKDLIHKLNLLFYAKEAICKDAEEKAKLEEFLSYFLKIGKRLNAVNQEKDSIDEYGRAFALGSRKSARAQVWMIKGDGQVFINGRPLSQHFSDIYDRCKAITALSATRTVGKYNVWALVENGGKKGQSEAVQVAIARALCLQEPALSEPLRKAGLTAIDRRQNERKKTGQPGPRKKYRWVKR